MRITSAAFALTVRWFAEEMIAQGSHPHRKAYASYPLAQGSNTPAVYVQMGLPSAGAVGIETSPHRRMNALCQLVLAKATVAA